NDPAAVIAMNSIKDKYRKQSIHLADLINDEFTQHDGRHSDGVIEQGVLVLCHVAMPAVLVETGFINNPDDEAYLNSDSGQNEIVASIIRALENYKSEVEQTTE
ncbi:MAG: N-acetylmuramoyl-L-alanine amidase family protein, partial [Mucilaginibacter sp.]